MFRSLIDGAKKLAINGAGVSEHTAGLDELFVQTTPDLDGEQCVHDCTTCTIHYPSGFKIDTTDRLYGFVKGWSTHLLVATGKTDWAHDVTEEKGSVMEAIKKASGPTNGRLMLSASNIPLANPAADYTQPTSVLLLPAFVVVDHVTPTVVPDLLTRFVSTSPTSTSPLTATLPLPPPLSPPLVCHPSPHSVLVLLCSQKTRDARCGQSAPLLRRELERHLRPLGLLRNLDDDRPGGVGIYFISHVGGHKYSANMMIYRRPDAFGIDSVAQGDLAADGNATLSERIRMAAPAVLRSATVLPVTDVETNGDVGDTALNMSAAGASQCIWLARVKPEDCENIVRYTILQGKVVKPRSQLRGGFDRARGVLSW